MEVGFVGLGRMGAAMVERLLDQGVRPMVWNRTAERLGPAVARGAKAAASLSALVKESDLVLSILTDDAALDSCYRGREGLFGGDITGKLFVEMSTVRPDTVRRLAAEAEQAGARFIDAPVSGTVAPARDGKLVIVAGGDAQDIERARPVLSLLSRRVRHMGPVGAGATMKLVLNMPLAVYWQSLGEGLAMGERLGLDRGRMLATIADSPAALGALPLKLDILQGAEAPVGYDIAGVCKDLLLATSTAHGVGVPAPSATTALACYAAAANNGWDAKDVVQVVGYLSELGRAPRRPG